MMNLYPKAPPETKVVAGVSTTGIVAIISQLFQTYWPSVHLPPSSLMLLIAAALGGLVSYYAPHTNVTKEIETVAGEVLQIVEEHHKPAPVVQAHNGPAPLPPPAQPLEPLPPQVVESWPV